MAALCATELKEDRRGEPSKRVTKCSELDGNKKATTLAKSIYLSYDCRARQWRHSHVLQLHSSDTVLIHDDDLKFIFGKDIMEFRESYVWIYENCVKDCTKITGM